MLDPPESDCSGVDGHEWDDDGVWSRGGGVVSRERCGRCWTAKVTNTWARYEGDGSEGRTVIKYERPESGDDAE